MSEILKPSQLCLLLLAAAVILSQFIILGCCGSDANIVDPDTGSVDLSVGDFNNLTNTNTLIPTVGNIASVASFDKHSVLSYGNGDMGLANNMQTVLTQDPDGSILKTRRISTFSYGSELMEITDISGLTSTDTLGNQYGKQSEGMVTLKNCDYPFALLKEDLTKISSDGISIDDIGSKTFLLLPDSYSADDLAMFTSTFGDSNVLDIRMFKYSNDTTALFNDAQFNLSMAGLDINGIFGQIDIMGFIQEFIDLIKKQQEQEKNDPNYNRWDSNGGVAVNWAEIQTQ